MGAGRTADWTTPPRAVSHALLNQPCRDKQQSGASGLAALRPAGEVIREEGMRSMFASNFTLSSSKMLKCLLLTPYVCVCVVKCGQFYMTCADGARCRKLSN